MARKRIVLAGGCFWGLEELLRTRPGILNTEVGYTGGTNDRPTYENHPGHAEAVQVEYDDRQSSLEDIYRYYFRIHDPTTMNKQGNDVGSSYRSTIFYKDETERQVAEHIIQDLTKRHVYPDPIVTTLEPLTTFWTAEEYHQDYLQKHPGGYTCHFERPAQ